MIGMAIMTVSFMTACGKKQENTAAPQEAVEQAEQKVEEANAQVEEVTQEAIEATETEELVADYVGKMDLAGSWDDEVSQRASMDVTRRDDGSYDIYVHWGISANETAIWEIHGTYDEVSGMLSYENGAYSIHTWDDNDEETVSGEETTKGAFMKEGDKLRWQDSKNTDDGVFVKVK